MNRLDRYSLNYHTLDKINNDAHHLLHHHHSGQHSPLQQQQQQPQLDRQQRYTTTPPALMPSPPELLHDSGEDESDDEMIHDHATNLPYLTSLPASIIRQRESSIRSDSKPCVAFEDKSSVQYLGSTHLQSRQNHLPAHHTKLPSSSGSPNNRRKSVPHRSPAAIQDALQATAMDQSIVFQLNVSTDPFAHESFFDTENIESKVICGESLLTALRTRVTSARHERRSKHSSPRHRPMVVAHKIAIPRSPKSHKRRKSPEAVSPSELANAFTDMTVYTPHRDQSPRRSHAFDYRSQLEDDDADEKMSEPSSEVTDMVVPDKSPSPRSKSKGPCQACQEVSDGCMRKGFNWPFETAFTYYDKGKQFVYLCNKCGLRYNKSNGCVCRHCRWVFCKEEKRKALQHIEKMRASRPGGKVDMDEFIEGFVCSPKYWACGERWRVGWVLNANANE